MPSISPRPLQSTQPTPPARHAGRFRLLTAALAVGATVLLASCGGGGGGDDDNTTPGSGLLPSSTYAQKCAAPRAPGTVDPFTGRAYGDVPGTLTDEKLFLRSWIDETYLWYRDVAALSAATLDPANYSTPQSYFAALKTPATTASGKAKDQFHFTYSTPTWVALATSGASYGYGFQIALLSATPPRRAVVAYTDPGTPAATAGVARGDAVLTVDGADLANGSDVATLNAGLFPSATGSHTFTFRRVDNSTYSVTLNAATVVSTPVQNVKTLPAPNGNVGYLTFNDHIATAEQQLVNAVNTLNAANGGAGITDLVLDLRYNGGGYLDIAAELAYMIAGPTQTGGKFFERLQFNDKNPFGLSTAQSTTDFHSTGQGFSVSSGTALPTLRTPLTRVYVLTSGDTCSASEAVINGLRGAGVTVNTIGGTTCGKPYGFYPRDNCNTTYFSIQFKGVNYLGYGDYADGFTPTCSVADDYTKPLGDPAENQLEVALGLRNTGSCTAPVTKTAAAAKLALTGSPASLVRSALRENRFYKPEATEAR